jgi:Fur family transcriptional regulator, ferric uptake regulator
LTATMTTGNRTARTESPRHVHTENGVKVRSTRQRQAVVEVLENAGDFRSAQQLHALLRERGDTVGLSTVYRTLQSLTEAGHLDAMRAEDGETLYRHCATRRRHHHLVCRECGRTIEVPPPAIDQWSEGVAAESGFSNLTHRLDTFGTCPDCA